MVPDQMDRVGILTSPHSFRISDDRIVFLPSSNVSNRVKFNLFQDMRDPGEVSNLNGESLFPLDEIADYWQPYRLLQEQPSIETVKRWATQGLRGQRLATSEVEGIPYTSEQELYRFNSFMFRAFCPIEFGKEYVDTAMRNQKRRTFEHFQHVRMFACRIAMRLTLDARGQFRFLPAANRTWYVMPPGARGEHERIYKRDVVNAFGILLTSFWEGIGNNEVCNVIMTYRGIFKKLKTKPGFEVPTWDDYCVHAARVRPKKKRRGFKRRRKLFHAK